MLLPTNPAAHIPRDALSAQCSTGAKRYGCLLPGWAIPRDCLCMIKWNKNRNINLQRELSTTWCYSSELTDSSMVKGAGLRFLTCPYYKSFSVLLLRIDNQQHEPPTYHWRSSVFSSKNSRFPFFPFLHREVKQKQKNCSLSSGNKMLCVWVPSPTAIAVEHGVKASPGVNCWYAVISQCQH